MADVEVREQLPARRQPAPPALSAHVAGASRRVADRLWPTVKLLARPLGLYLASRIVVYAAIGVVIMLHLGIATVHFTGPWPVNPRGPSLFEALGTWDGGWYMRIASHGYTTSMHPPSAYTPTVAFLPALPVLLRITQFVTGLNILYAGVLTTFVLGAVASVCVWLFTRRLTGAATADRATALWCFFPGAVTLSLVYTEGLLVILVVVCLFALMRGRWLLAGIAAAGASATGPEGLALCACCAWAAGVAILARPGGRVLMAGGDRTASTEATGPAAGSTGWRRWSPLIAPLLAPMGWLVYQVYLWRRTGDPTLWYHVETKFWYGGFHPWAATIGTVRQAFEHPGIPNSLIPSLGLFVLVVAAILLWRWKPPALVTIYAAVAMALVLSSGALGARPRFFIAVFPFVIALARPARGPVFHALIGTSAAALALLTVILVTFASVALAYTP